MELELSLFVGAGATICDQCPIGSSSAVIGRFLVFLGLVRIHIDAWQLGGGVCVLVFVRECVRACLRECASCVCARGFACVHGCVRAHARTYVCLWTACMCLYTCSLVLSWASYLSNQTAKYWILVNSESCHSCINLSFLSATNLE